ncbi:MAG: histidine kinase [Sphingomonadales bacterium]|nr:histidine kinase [Sphingomonadales bacterium]
MYVEPIAPPASSHASAARVAGAPNPPESASLVPMRMVVGSAALLWVGYFLLVTLRSIVVEEIDFAEMLAPRAVVAASGVIVTLLAWVVLRRFDRRPLWQRVAVALVMLVPCAVALAFINQQAFAAINSRIETMHAQAGRLKQGAVKIRQDSAGNLLIDVPDPSYLSPGQLQQVREKMEGKRFWQEMTDIGIGRYFLLLAWAALYIALVNGEQARAAERREGDFRRAAKAAELRSLRYQVNPHFLFNTLNSLSALVMTGRADDAERMIQTLSTFYRRTLAGDPTSDIALADEIALQRLYLEIEAVRFPDRLRTRIVVPQALERMLVPGMILQPLIENSVKYAVALSQAPVTVTIEAREDSGMLELTVSDDGPGAAAGATRGSAVGCGIGLGNVRDRLAARFGPAATLETGRRAQGYRTVLRMPLETGASGQGGSPGRA